MNSQNLTFLDDWFKPLAQSLKLLADPLEPLLVQDALKTYLGARVVQMLPLMSDPTDMDLWLSYVLQTNVLIRLWDDDQPVIVACYLSSKIYYAQQNLALITGTNFQAARQALGIAHHWVLLFEVPMFAIRPSTLLDSLYNQLGQATECAIIDLQ